MSKTFTITGDSGTTACSGSLSGGTTTTTVYSSDVADGSTFWVDGSKWCSAPKEPEPSRGNLYREDHYDEEWGAWA